MNVKAAIFDLDGTVLSDEGEYGKAFAKVLNSLGVEVKSKYPHVGGIGVKENWSIFLKKYKIQTERTEEDLTSETQQEYLKLLPKVRLKKGFYNFAKMLRASEIKLALATSNTGDIVEEVFSQFNIEDLFDVVTTGEEVDRKKPDPQIFLQTAEKLHEPPGNCLVFEDSKAGIDAAHVAGIKVVGITRNDKHKQKLKEADFLATNFTKLSLEKLKHL